MPDNSDKSKGQLKIPAGILAPIKKFLEDELNRLSRAKRTIVQGDPFADENRDGQNSLEEDVDEQIGHFDAEVKAKFLNKQIVQIRQALTRMKIGKYGICESCGKMIDTDRLAVQPEATLCLKCAKEKE